MTGNMLFEIVDPSILWKQIYLAIRAGLSPSSSMAKPAPSASSSINLARFIVKTFRLHDEEVQRLHAPIVALAVLDLVEVRCTPHALRALLAHAFSDRTEPTPHRPPLRPFRPPSTSLPNSFVKSRPSSSTRPRTTRHPPRLSTSAHPLPMPFTPQTTSRPRRCPP